MRLIGWPGVSSNELEGSLYDPSSSLMWGLGIYLHPQGVQIYPQFLFHPSRFREGPGVGPFLGCNCKNLCGFYSYINIHLLFAVAHKDTLRGRDVTVIPPDRDAHVGLVLFQVVGRVQ